ncbi:MAG: F0F1 ATP synthase subunit A [Candidatus Hinthialibacter antarcticus]|nr:F0F1 ATP synthase subunit A [Candidatus Hinthialibacter antarcticus]
MNVASTLWFAVIQASEEAGHAVEHAAESASHGQEAAAIPELPNFVHALHVYFPHNQFIELMRYFENQIFIILAIAAIAAFFYTATRKCSIIPGRLQACAELIIEALLGIVTGILGEKEGRRYFPFIGSLFLFIFTMNWFGLIPLMKSPTSSFAVTSALAICVFLYVQFAALTRLGPAKYFYHLMGEPKDAVGWGLVPLFLPLHIMEEFIKPLSLACRLFGNIFGEDMLLGIALILGVQMVVALIPMSPVGIPLHLPFVFLSMLLGTIQALVFSLLATVYISMVLPHEEHH